MGWIYYNPNPRYNITGDCVVRAIAIASGISWDEAFKGIVSKAYELKDMPSINPVWTDYLRDSGYSSYTIPNTCPRCYTVRNFTQDNKTGTYILGTGSHVVAVIDGNYIDTWDSGNEIPKIVFKKG